MSNTKSSSSEETNTNDSPTQVGDLKPNHAITFDKEQFTQVIATLQHPSASFWSVENLQKIVQLSAIVVGGCWVLMQFFAFERETKVLAVEQTKLNYETQKSQTELRKKELERDLELKALELKLNQLKITQEEHTSEYRTTYRFTKEASISVKQVRRLSGDYGLFQVEYIFRLSNESEVPLEISAFVLDAFVGHWKPALTNITSEQSAALLGVPENRWNSSSGYSSAVTWEKTLTSGSIHAEAAGRIKSPWDSVLKDSELVHGGGATGLWKPNEKMAHTETYIVRARYGELFAVVANVCFNRAAKNEDLFWKATDIQFPEAEPAIESVKSHCRCSHIVKQQQGAMKIIPNSRRRFRQPRLQRRIVAELDTLQAEVDALKRLQAETAAELDALLPALLDRAFKGEL